MIQERAARVVIVQRPAGSMNYQARLMLGRVDVPQLLDAQAVVLRITTLVQLVARQQTLADMAAAAFSKQGVLGAQLYAGSVHAVFRIAVTVNAHVAGQNAIDRTLIIDQGILGSKAGINFDTEVFCLLGQPAAEVAK